MFEIAETKFFLHNTLGFYRAMLAQSAVMRQ